MSDVNVQLVREFFELSMFRVMTRWQHDSLRARGADHGFQLMVENAGGVSTVEPGFVLRVGEVTALSRALVEVRAWHADRMYASLIEPNSALFDVASEESVNQARQFFGTDDFKKVLVISELPSSAEARQRSVSLIEQAGIDHLIEFPTILRDILDRINPHVSYAPSHTLQTLRLLKRYNFVKFQQLEFPFPTEAPVSASGPAVETALLFEHDATDEAEE